MTAPTHPDGPPATPTALVDRVAVGTVAVALTFAGQGASPLGELSALWRRHPELHPLLEDAAALLGELADHPDSRRRGAVAAGVDLIGWLAEPELAPDDRGLAEPALAYPLTLLCQAATWRVAADLGLAGATAAVRALAGHSQGTLAALLIAEAGLTPPDGELVMRHLRASWRLGLHLGEGDIPPGPGPMAEIAGPRTTAVREALARVNAGLDPAHHLDLALVNSPTRTVVAGPPPGLAALRHHLGEGAEWTPLAVGAPFHSRHLARAAGAAHADDELRRLLGDIGSLPVAVLDPADGGDLRRHRDPVAAVIDGQFTAPVRWDLTCRALEEAGADWVLDLGPGTAVGRLTAENLRGSGLHTLGLASPEGRRRLTTAGATPAGPALDYATLRPRPVRTADGRLHLDTRFSRTTGHPPVILAGMTPTTADVPIVAAAANAGYLAELAGGGQADARTVELRLHELAAALEPGRQVVWNTLLLDPHLWGLHYARRGLVPRARAAGAPLAGMTISAGVPDAAEAQSILDRLERHGLRLNALKAGTVEQIRRVLSAADAAPERPLALHIEGGQAGGHHSRESLDELLLATYHEVRRRPNLLLCAGGGVGTPQRARQLLLGEWSQVHGERPMPVDAVLVGTAAMACAEATASPAVKRALVAAPGRSGWTAAEGAAGSGVTSGRSALGADIHLLDNGAAATARLVARLAADPVARRARRDELIAALNAGSKPYLGDLEDMTYGAALARLTELCAIGDGGRYADGPWGHRDWRLLVRDTYRRWAARLDPAQRGPVTPPVNHAADLDDPGRALERFAAALPAAGQTLLHPADARWLIGRCDRGGRPVPFVPAIDDSLARHFGADNLWQAQDARFAADRVAVIPGPEAVAGITRADEPVAELLARMEADALEGLAAAGITPRERPHLATGGLAPAPLRALAEGDHGPLGALCRAPALLRHPAETAVEDNPLWRLVAPGDRITTARGPDGTLRELRCTPAGGHHGEHLRATAARDGRVELVLADRDGPWRAWSIRTPSPAADHHLPALVPEAPTARAARVRAAFTGHPSPHPPRDARCHGGRWRLDGPGLRALHRSLGHRGDGVALDVALSLAWPAMARALTTPALAEVAHRVLHTHHAIEPGPAWPPAVGEGGRVRARMVLAEAPADGGGRLRCEAVLDGERGRLATVTSELRLPAGPPTAIPQRVVRRSARLELPPLDGPAVALLARAGAESGNPLVLEVGLPATVVAHTESHHGAERVDHRTRGRLTQPGRPPHPLDGHATGPADGEHPLWAALELLRPAQDEPRERPGRELARRDLMAPRRMETHAAAAGDHNPLHRRVLAARLAGWEEPIVHGAWTAAHMAALAVEGPAGGRAGDLARWRVDFTAPLPTGRPLEVVAERVGVAAGRRVVRLRAESEGTTVATGTAELERGGRALVFPGQGVHRPGIGAQVRERSPAAAAMWRRLDDHTRRRFGFSLTEIAEDNPATITDGTGRSHHHPEGVLYLTEFTQPVLVALACAQLAELREQQVVGRVAVAAGHSVGEFSALVALGVLEPEAAVELVHLRGVAMQLQVPRDRRGASAHGMAAVDPAACGLDGDGLDRLVAGLTRTDQPLEVVNRNAHGRQYAVAGTLVALERLEEALGGRAGGGRRPLRRLRGIDIPFHSRLLGGVAQRLAPHLERLLPAEAGRIAAGRWVSNLTGRLFAPRGDGRAELIESLAAQAAAPVRWATCWDTLITPRPEGGGGADEVVEVGPVQSPVLSDLAALTPPSRPVAILHSERDRERVWDLDGDPSPPDELPVATPAPARAAAPSPPPPGAAAIADEGPDAADGLAMVIALQAGLRPDQIAAEDTLDDLFQGASSRRNQALVDIGREFGLSAADGVHERSIGELGALLGERVGAYRFPGPYLREALATGLQRALAGSGLGAAAARRHLTEGRGLPAGAAERVLADLVLETRAGPSVRAGVLGRLADGPTDGPALLDAALELTGTRRGWPALGHHAPAATSTPAAESAAADPRLGGALRRAAAGLLADLDGVAAGGPTAGGDGGDGDEARARLALLDRELGPERAALLAPLFDAERMVELSSPWAWGRGGLLALFHDGLAGRLDPRARDAEAARLAVHRTDPIFARQADRLARRAAALGNDGLAGALAATLTGPVAALAPEGLAPRPGGEVPDGDRPGDIIRRLDEGGDRGPVALEDPALAAALADRLRATRGAPLAAADQVALITGASPGSIAAGALAHLLRGGARVVVATSTLTPARRRWYRDLYRRVAAPGARLHLLPANLANLGDIAALVDWCHRPTAPAIGPPRPAPEPLIPTLVLPFAATPGEGSMDRIDRRAEVALRLQLLGVESLIGRLAAVAGPAGLVAVLPLSPNHGLLGHDGIYPETKAALEVVAGRRAAEAEAWGSRVAVLGARIGWVRGTGLMGAADRLAHLVEAEGELRTFAADEMGWLLAAAATDPRLRAAAAREPLTLDATGGLGRGGDLGERLRRAAAAAAAAGHTARRRAALIAAWERRTGPAAPAEPTVEALPSPPTGLHRAPAPADRRHALDPADLVVVVGTGELGPGGSGRTRFELEWQGGPGPAGILELARLCGLIVPDLSPEGTGWRDAAGGEPVTEERIAERYGAAVAERIGVRPLHDDADLRAAGIEVLSAVTLSEPLRVEVADRAEAEALHRADPTHTTIEPPVAPGEPWRIIRAAGAQVRLPGRVAHDRRVAGQLPRGYDTAPYGIPADMVAAADPMAAVNLATVVDAFWDAGIGPEELTAHIDPTLIANTQGAGTGGMVSRRRLLLDHLLGRPRQADRLQESLGNVPAAHAVQSFIGSYGPMIHPVAACATAAVSLEVALGTIATGRALAAVVGGFDDISTDGVVGFADMGATADSNRLDAAGIAPHEASRAGDLRRAGFVEAQGGGTALVMRGDLALELGLPVRGVIAYAASFADGIHSSIPAPGLGLLGAARGGADSPLGRALARLGLGADDIGVISKHDTSTALNDPNEADLHERILAALGRAPGEPVAVVSQKTVTGHAKGGAAAWQLDGLLRMLESGLIPANPHLESADPALADGPHLVVGHPGIHCAPRAPLRLGLLASLGFGHVSSLVAVAHPDLFLESIPAGRRREYLDRAAARRARGAQERLRAWMGHPTPARRDDRGVGDGGAEDRREQEARMLLSPDGHPQRRHP